jgi:nicotinate-nucleotide adenylyltransferase
MQKMMGILGGTFDPIHHGHLRVALEAYQQLKLDEVRFVPCQKPVLKNDAQASVEQRLTMLRLATQKQAGFCVDERELQRATPSYMIDTLISLRAEFSSTVLCLLIGADSFNELPQWHRWQELIQYAHLIIVSRPDTILTAQDALKDFLQQHEVTNKQQLTEEIAGKIYQMQLPPLAISSTYIRSQIAQGLSPRYLIPEAVGHYIQQNHLYESKL